MPRGKGIYDDEDADPPKDEPEVGHGSAEEGGAETPEDAPDVADTGGEPTA